MYLYNLFFLALNFNSDRLKYNYDFKNRRILYEFRYTQSFPETGGRKN